MNSAVAAGMEFRSNGWNALVSKGNGWKPAVPGKRLEVMKEGLRSLNVATRVPQRRGRGGR